MKELLTPDHLTSPAPAVELSRDPIYAEAESVVSSIILPAYNEAEALPQVLAALFRILDERSEVIVVDDGSTDDTQAVASRYPCRLISHASNRGKGAAVRTGIKEARGRYIIVMDSDNTYPASAIERVHILLEEYDLVRCVRTEDTSNIPPLNRLGNVLFDSMLNIICRVSSRDFLSGLYGIRKDKFDELNVTANGFDLEVEIAIKSQFRKLRWTAIPIRYSPRIGEKKLKPWRDGWKILSRLVVLALLYKPIDSGR